MSLWSDLSKEVGWDQVIKAYPRKETVEAAFKIKDYCACLQWYRFLPSPTNQKEITVVNLLADIIKCIRQELEESDGE